MEKPSFYQVLTEKVERARRERIAAHESGHSVDMEEGVEVIVDPYLAELADVAENAKYYSDGEKM